MEADLTNQKVHNPHLAETMFTLSDGIARRFCFDLNAMVVYQEVQKTVKSPAAFVRAALYAGLHADALERGEGDKWTLRYVGALVTPEQLDRLTSQVSLLVKEAKFGPGESPAGSSTPVPSAI